MKKIKKAIKKTTIYLLFKIISLMVSFLPDKARDYLGRGLGRLTYFLTESRREVARNNFKKVYGDKMTVTDISQIVKDIYRHLGQLLVEFLLLRKVDRDNFENYVQVENEEYLKEAYDRGQGVIIYSAHFGNWEWLAALVSLLGYPTNAIAREQNNTDVDKEINRIRASKGINIIFKGLSVREAFRCLRKGECLFILGDQDARRRGWKMEFFNQPASTYPGPVQLARRTGAAVVPAFLIRERWGKHRLVFYPPHYVKKEATREEQEDLLQELTTLTESVIRQHKEQWLWVHKRWKTFS